MVSFTKTLECPAESPISFVDILAEYMQRQYQTRLQELNSAVIVIPNIQIPLPVVMEADRIVGLLVEARNNPCKTP